MMNNNTQVSPRNGVDFSKIRKAREGLKIPKFQNPYQKLDLTTDEYNTRRNVYAAKEDFFTNGQYDFEKMFQYYKAHPEQFRDLSSITATPTWEGAVRNTKGFKDWNSQFNDTGLNYFFGYDANKANYFGPTTSARKAFLDYINQRNSQQPEETTEETITTGGTPTGGTPTEGTSTGGNNTGGNNGITQRTYTPTEYFPAFQWKPQPFTSPIPNGIIAGLSLAANKHWFDNEMEKKAPLLEAPSLQGKVTNNYAARQIRNQQMADARSRAQQQLGSDQIQNQQYLQAVEQNLQPLENQNAVDQTQEFNETSQKLENIQNQNKLTWSQIANQNRSNLVADWNRRLDAKSKYQLQRNAIWADNTLKNWTDYGHWKANEENERDAALSSYNDYLAQRDLQNFRKPYEDFINDPYSSNTFNQLYSQANQYFEDNRGSTAWNKNDPYFFLDSIFGNDGSEEDKKKAFLAYLRSNHDSEYGKQYESGYNSEATDLYNQYITNANKVQNRLAFLKPSFRNTYTFEGFWNPKALGKQYQSMTYKRGGILKMKAGSRFVDYLEHNRKALKDHNQITMENVKLTQKTLQAQLESIDRETLILLRSIFK